jgi:hypothetical protein
MHSNEHDSRNEIVPAATSNESARPAPTDGVPRGVAAPIGAVGGAVAGAAAGTVIVGPMGTIVGAIAGAIGGGWTALAAFAPTHYNPEHDREYREHFESDAARLADRTFDTARPAYQLGHLAARNPDYAQRDFESIESDLQHGWSADVRARHGDWSVARRYVREAFVRERARIQGRAPVEVNMAGSDTHQRASFADPIAPGDPDRVAGDRTIIGRGAKDASGSSR